MNKQEIEIDGYVPDYESDCEICGMSPTVQAELDGEIIYQSGMCGVCTFGESSCLFPENW